MTVRVSRLGLVAAACAAFVCSVAACGESTHNNAAASGAAGTSNAGGGSAAATTAGSHVGGSDNAAPQAGENSASGGASAGDAGEAGAGGATEPSVLTCATAAQGVGYQGCDFWPTFVANPVWELFTPGIVVANEGYKTAQVTIEGPNGVHQTLVVTPGSARVQALPWSSAALKGPEWSTPNTSGARTPWSARVTSNAYHVTSNAPVVVWQFNPLRQQQSAPDCPQGLSLCRAATNDGTLLFPSTSLSGNYRVATYSTRNGGPDWGSLPGGVAITATADDTKVTFQAGPRCGAQQLNTNDLGPCTASGDALSSRHAGGLIELTLNAGDVLQIMGALADKPALANADLSGSVINATHPVQVISFSALANVPDDSVANSNHLEELLPPAESLAKRYVVVPPSAPAGPSQGHVVRLYGNVDGTHLTYPDGKPTGAPDALNAGDVVQIPPLSSAIPAPDCATLDGHCVLNEAFVVEADQPFAVASFMPGGKLQSPAVDATLSTGDPNQTFTIPPQQFAQSFAFYVPDDFISSYADVLVPQGAQVLLDGAPLAQAPTAVGTSEWGVARLKIANAGLHRVQTEDPRGVGGQIMSFGFATALYYAAGSKQLRLSEPPVTTP